MTLVDRIIDFFETLREVAGLVLFSFFERRITSSEAAGGGSSAE